MTTYNVKQGDAGTFTPQSFLEDGAGAAVNLAGATVRFVMRAHGADTAKVAAAAEVVGDGSTGEVRYEWQAADLDTPGVYRAEWEVTYTGGAVETFPADGYITVVVVPDLD